MDYIVHGILQARILEWVAFPFSRGSSQPRDWTQVSWNAGGFFTIWTTRKPKNTGVSSLSLLQWIFPNQESNQGLLQCRQILYHLSHQGSSRILEWVAYPFSSGSSQTRNWTRVSWIAGRFFTNWTTRETLHNVHKMPKLMSCCMSIIFQLKKKAELLSEVEEKKCQLSSSEPDRVPEMWLAQSMRSIRYPRLLELVCDHEFR